MTSPYQHDVVGCIQEIALDLLPDSDLHITNIPDWATYRWIIEPIYGAVNPDLTYIHAADVPAALQTSGMYDTGWWGSGSGYSQGDVIAAIDTEYHDWFMARGLAVPETRKGPVMGLPYVLPLGFGATGVRITSFVYFGSHDANNLGVSFDTADPGGKQLVELSPSYYYEDATGYFWRTTWAPPYTGPGTIAANAVPLSTIVSRICKRGGLEATDIDVADYSSIMVHGYPIARQANAADCLLPLTQAYFGYASEYDAQLHFKFYGENAAVTINSDDLIENTDSEDGNISSNLRNQATEFPRRIVGSYMDPAQNYGTVTVAAERRSVDVTAIGDQQLQIPVVMSADDAANAVNKALKVTYATLEGTVEYATPFADSDVYISLAAGEPVIFSGKRYVVDEMVLGNGSLKLTTRYDRQSAYTSNVQAIVGNLPTAPSSPYSGPTALIPMNLPAQRPQDSLGVYIAAASADGRGSWKGCTVQVSYDNKQSWVNALTITMESKIGRVAFNEPTGGEPITVNMVKYALESVSGTQIAAGANAFAVVDDTGNVTQLGQFATATPTATVQQFELTDTLRSLGGTSQQAIRAGNPFTMMDAAYFLPIDASFTGSVLYFRGVGFGEVAENARIYPLTYLALVRQSTSQQITEDGVYAFVTEDGLKTLVSE